MVITGSFRFLFDGHLLFKNCHILYLVCNVSFGVFHKHTCWDKYALLDSTIRPYHLFRWEGRCWETFGIFRLGVLTFIVGTRDIKEDRFTNLFRKGVNVLIYEYLANTEYTICEHNNTCLVYHNSYKMYRYVKMYVLMWPWYRTLYFDPTTNACSTINHSAVNINSTSWSLLFENLPFI